MKYPLYILEVLLITMTSQIAYAVAPTAGEMRESRQWVSAKFGGAPDARTPDARMIVLSNNDPVQKNSRNGKPMKIGNAEYSSGLFCHAVSNVTVTLPAPGKAFVATVGVDSNEQTSGGRGSVEFIVEAGGKVLFRSGIMREGMPGLPLKIDLGGVREFSLKVSDGGDGISCDQADWVDAKALLADGSEIVLGDLPIEGQETGYNTDLPFSFTYGGKPSLEFLKLWKAERSSRKLDAQRTERSITLTDPATALQVLCKGIQYNDFPTVEWTLHLKNTGSTDTPVISDLQALGTGFARGAFGEFVLHHNVGSPYSPTDYQPLETTLAPNIEKAIGAAGGRSTNSDFSYFNIEWSGEGVIMVVGWPGQWQARFNRDGGSGLRLRAGMELTNFILHSGEEVRTPLIVMQFWKGDRVRAQNIWRRWMMAHSMPRSGGKLPPPHHAACSSHFFHEMVFATDKTQIQFIDRYLEEGLKLDYWWMDAGWYILNKTNPSALWVDTGTWEVDSERFPNGLKAVTDHGHARGVNSIVWFEPERVAPNTWLYINHPEWLLKTPDEDAASNRLLNLGNPQARAWLTEHIDGLLVSQGIDLYREDFNIDPLVFWRNGDAPDRQGITEIRYVEGHLAYWDELRRRRPNMLIDSCASGGRRNDLETMRRAVPLLRSDYILEPVSQQNHTYGIASWLPFFGTGQNRYDAYGFRSCMTPALNTCFDVRRTDIDYAALRRLIKQWTEQISPNYYGDYYPLTKFSAESNDWMAWQFDRPEAGEGMAQFFRRDASPYESARFRLQALDPNGVYEVTSIDSKAKRRISGKELVSEGLRINMPKRPEALVFLYRKL